jgi:hypothetical protein
MDPAWNTASENQAYDRVHRLGQTKPVLVERLVIANSIEQRILALQDKKQGEEVVWLLTGDLAHIGLGLADAALGEGAGGRLKRLTVKDLAGVCCPQNS